MRSLLPSKMWLHYNLLKRHIELSNNEIGLLLPYGLGDTYIVCSLLGEYKKLIGVTKCKLIVNEGHQYVASMFGLGSDVIAMTNMRELVNLVGKNGNEKKGEIFIAHPNYMRKGYYAELIGYRGLNLLDVYKIALGLNINCSVKSPKIRRLSNKEAGRLANQGLIKNRSVLIFPEANSIQSLPPKFWEAIADDLNAKGYKVYSSVLNSKNLIRGTIAINIKIKDLIHYAEFAGYVIAMRSGICDILATSKTNLTIIYPKKNWYQSDILTGSSLVSMGFGNEINEKIITSMIDIKMLLKNYRRI